MTCLLFSLLSFFNIVGEKYLKRFIWVCLCWSVSLAVCISIYCSCIIAVDSYMYKRIFSFPPLVLSLASSSLAFSYLSSFHLFLIFSLSFPCPPFFFLFLYFSLSSTIHPPHHHIHYLHPTDLSTSLFARCVLWGMVTRVLRRWHVPLLCTLVSIE